MLMNHPGDRRMFSVRGNERINLAMKRGRCGTTSRTTAPTSPTRATRSRTRYRFFGRPKVRAIKKGDYCGVGRKTRRDDFRGV
jgi:hypothetical protein